MRTVFTIAAYVLAASPALAGPVFRFDTFQPDQNNNGGRIGYIHSTFDPQSKAFAWDVTFSNGVSVGTDGYWLVVSNGPNPKDSRNQLAIIYFDATNLASPSVSVYRYNGENSDSSFETPGELLASNRGINAYGIQASTIDSGNRRTFKLSLDASGINANQPAGDPPAGTPGSEWEGIHFRRQIGVWFHPTAGLETAYSNRRLQRFDAPADKTGWFDGSNLTTTVEIPAPASVGLFAPALALAARRRRR